MAERKKLSLVTAHHPEEEGLGEEVVNANRDDFARLQRRGEKIYLNNPVAVRNGQTIGDCVKGESRNFGGLSNSLA